jgi:(p)ppGpp synthase/HD superfamily hydrolase
MKNLEPLLKKAIKIAHDAHHEQVDKAGKPYIEHPLRVMDNVQTLEEKIVGVLHDAVEDSDLTLEDLVKLGSDFCSYRKRLEKMQEVSRNPSSFAKCIARLALN